VNHDASSRSCRGSSVGRVAESRFGNERQSHNVQANAGQSPIHSDRDSSGDQRDGAAQHRARASEGGAGIAVEANARRHEACMQVFADPPAELRG